MKLLEWWRKRRGSDPGEELVLFGGLPDRPLMQVIAKRKYAGQIIWHDFHAGLARELKIVGKAPRSNRH